MENVIFIAADAGDVNVTLYEFLNKKYCTTLTYVKFISKTVPAIKFLLSVFHLRRTHVGYF